MKLIYTNKNHIIPKKLGSTRIPSTYIPWFST